MPDHSPSARRWLASVASATLIATPLAVLGSAGPAHAAPVDIQILGTNDFHGRILPNNDEAGAAQFAAAVAQFEADNPNSVFTAAGDLIGGSTFPSMIQQDKPTLDALNAAGLDVSAAGNHEFDKGYADLVDRVMKPFDAASNPLGGAAWQYLAANVRKKSDNSYALPDVAASPGASDGATWTTEIAGVQVGFVGVVTEDLESLVSAEGIADVKVTEIVGEVNTAADRLTADGADLVVMLVHEGAADTSIGSATDDSAFGRIVRGVDNDVDAIISGHTHQAYNHTIDGRPVVSAGQYGTNLNRLVFSVDPASGAVSVKANEIVAANDVEITDPAAQQVKTEVEALVADAEARAEVLGAVELGKISGALERARAGDSTSRGGESTIGNMVAEVHRWATSEESAGGAEIAFMNPGGIRDDMVGKPGGYPAAVTYKEAAEVQPFANTLVNMKMTGAQIKKVLEQQWQRDADGNVPSRPFLQLGTSKGFTSTFDAKRPEGNRITGMWLHGTPLEMDQTYSVTANAFLASGTGDNFWAFGDATDKRDTGKVDLDAMVDYMDTFGSNGKVVRPHHRQHFIGASWPEGRKRWYEPGERVKVNLSSLAMTGTNDVRDTEVSVRIGRTRLGTFPVDNTSGTVGFDDYGQAVVNARVTAQVPKGKRILVIRGNNSGTVLRYPVGVRRISTDITRTRVAPRPVRVHRSRARLVVRVTPDRGTARATGRVRVKVAGRTVVRRLVNGRARIPLGRFHRTGRMKVRVVYLGNARYQPSGKVLWLRVRR